MGPMEALVIAVLAYLAIGAACFAHPPAPALPDDFHWRRQLDVFRDNLADVLLWPLALYRFLAGFR